MPQVDLLGIFLGWLFGLLSPGVAEHIQNSAKRKRLTSALLAEVEELELTLVLLAWRVRVYLGTVDDAFAVQVARIASEYHGTDLARPELANLKNPANLMAVAGAIGQSGKSLALKIYDLPLLDASLGDLTLCDATLQRELLQVKASLSHLNANVDSIATHIALTFDTGLTAQNHAVVTSNLQNLYRRYSQRVEGLLSTTSKILKETRRG